MEDILRDQIEAKGSQGYQWKQESLRSKTADGMRDAFLKALLEVPAGVMVSHEALPVPHVMEAFGEKPKRLKGTMAHYVQMVLEMRAKEKGRDPYGPDFDPRLFEANKIGTKIDRGEIRVSTEVPLILSTMDARVLEEALEEAAKTTKGYTREQAEAGLTALEGGRRDAQGSQRCMMPRPVIKEVCEYMGAHPGAGSQPEARARVREAIEKQDKAYHPSIVGIEQVRQRYEPVLDDEHNEVRGEDGKVKMELVKYATLQPSYKRWFSMSDVKGGYAPFEYTPPSKEAQNNIMRRMIESSGMQLEPWQGKVSRVDLIGKTVGIPQATWDMAKEGNIHAEYQMLHMGLQGVCQAKALSHKDLNDPYNRSTVAAEFRAVLAYAALTTEHELGMESPIMAGREHSKEQGKELKYAQFISKDPHALISSMQYGNAIANAITKSYQTSLEAGKANENPGKAKEPAEQVKETLSQLDKNARETLGHDAPANTEPKVSKRDSWGRGEGR